MKFSQWVFPILALLCFVTPMAVGQSPQPTGVQQEIIRIRTEKLELIRDEIQKTDARIESRMASIVEVLTAITDSQETRTRVARLKEDTMKKLAATMEYYDRARAQLREELRNPRKGLSATEIQSITDIFDARVEKRAEQILALNRSMPTPKDYEQYRNTGGGGWDNGKERNPAYEQNRRISSHTNSQVLLGL